MGAVPARQPPRRPLRTIAPSSRRGADSGQPARQRLEEWAGRQVIRLSSDFDYFCPLSGRLPLEESRIYYVIIWCRSGIGCVLLSGMTNTTHVPPVYEEDSSCAHVVWCPCHACEHAARQAEIEDQHTTQHRHDAELRKRTNLRKP